MFQYEVKSGDIYILKELSKKKGVLALHITALIHGNNIQITTKNNNLSIIFHSFLLGSQEGSIRYMTAIKLSEILNSQK